MSRFEREPARLGVADAGELLTLQRAAYVPQAQLHEDFRLPPLMQTLPELQAELADATRQAWGVREAERLVASVRVWQVDPTTAEVGRLVVAPDRQGNGLGSGLLSWVEEQLDEAVRTVRLFTGDRSVANLRLYRRLGYEETGRVSAGEYQLVHLAKQRSTDRA